MTETKKQADKRSAPDLADPNDRERQTVETIPMREVRWSSPALLAWIALGLGFAFEVLFYGKRLGISFPLWAGLSIAGMLLASRLQRIRPGRVERWLPAPILFFASLVFLRTEPLTVALSVTTTLALFAIWVRTFRSADLEGYGWSDFLLALVLVPLESWIRPWGILSAAQRQALAGKQARSHVFAAARGIVLALPVLLVFTALLSQADLVFADSVERALRWLDLDRILDFLGRATVIALSGLFSLGAIVVGLRERRSRAGGGRELVRPFLGFTEAAVVLVSVELILLLFVGIQVRYLFGGEANVTAAGYTYAEYARRGFGELVAVSVLSLGLVLGLAMVTLRTGRGRDKAYHSLSALLVLEVGVVLASALMRLLLYENAYGFTRLRTYTHVAILWMAALFVSFLALLLSGRLRRFAQVSAAGALGFVATLGLLNVDAFIVRQNAQRMAQTGEIDLPYLFSLSEDAVPDLVDLQRDGRGAFAEQLGSELACWRAQLQSRRTSWPSTQGSRSAAQRALNRMQSDAPADPAWRTSQGTWMHWIGGEVGPCLHQSWPRDPR